MKKRLPIPFCDLMSNGCCRLIMSSQPLPIDENVIASLKARREELMSERTTVLVANVCLWSES